MNKCRILFYLCICFLVPVVTVQAQPFTQFTFPPNNNTVSASVPIEQDSLSALDDSAFSIPGVSGNKITNPPFDLKQCYHHFLSFDNKKKNIANQSGSFELIKKTGYALTTALLTVKNAFKLNKISSNP